MCRRRLASILLCLCLAASAFAHAADSSGLEIYNGCGMEGDARRPGVQALNRLKNRYTAPQQIDPAIKDRQPEGAIAMGVPARILKR